jgi:cytochrome c-type biogenesis protein CcmF
MMTVVAAIGSWVWWRRRSNLLRPATIVSAAVAGALLAAVATLASPFTQLAMPAIDGRGLLAILRHPAMLIHPPLLYLGHTLLLVPFAATAAALVTNTIDGSWLRLVRRWLLLSWTTLTLAMALGSMWAYVELGWGGFWAWDAVENSALLPWLAITAFLHTSRIQERSGRLQRWNAALAMLPFVMTVLGIYLTRSGLTGSVHAFAESEGVGRFALGLVVAAVVTWIVLIARHRTTAGSWRIGERGEPWYVINAALLLWTIAVIAVGSTYPLFGRAIGASVSVAPRWFVVMLFPVVLVALAGMGLAPWSRGESSLGARAVRQAVAACVAFVLMIFIGERSLVPMLIVAAAAGAVVSIGYELAKRRPGRGTLVAGLGHLGLALILFGAAGSAFGSEFHGGVVVGERVSVGGYDLFVTDITAGRGDGYSFVAADVVATKASDEGSRLVPEWRGYDGSVLPTPEPVLRSGLVEDIVVAISRVSDDGAVVWLDVFVRPLVIWVWLGALLVGLSGLVGLATTVGSSAGRRRSATATLPPVETTVDTLSS